MKIEIQVKAVAAGESGHGNTDPKLVPTGFLWAEAWGTDGTPFCVHGEKMRWSCDYCREHFKKHPMASTPNDPSSATGANSKDESKTR